MPPLARVARAVAELALIASVPIAAATAGALALAAIAGA